MHMKIAEETVSSLNERLTSGDCPACGYGRSDELLRAPDRFHGRKIDYEIVRCQACSLVWLKNPPPPEEMGQHYGADYDRKIAAAGETSPSRWRDRRVALAEYKQGGRILDLGCSSGSFLATLNSQDWELHGIEMSLESAARAKAKCGAEVFVGDILDAPYAAESFDAITCFHVFEHIYQPREVLEKVSQWLKPGGVFYVLVPNIDSAGRKVFGTYWYALELPRHLSHFSPKSLSSVARAAGLEQASLTTDREVFIEYSMRYVLDDMLSAAGIHRVSLAASKPSSFPRKVVRKLYRWSLQPVITGAIGLAGDGESIHAFFRKPL